jgi:hypothetical protein
MQKSGREIRLVQCTIGYLIGGQTATLFCNKTQDRENMVHKEV